MNKALVALALSILFGHFVFKKRKLAFRAIKVPYKSERVLILGCSSGIGKDIALNYASRGAKLFLFARRKELLEKLQSDCQAAGSSAVHHLAGDVTSQSDLKKLAQLVQESFGGIDTVIYCAGMISVRPFLESCGVNVEKDAEGNFQAQEKVNSDTRALEVDEALSRITTINYFAAVWTARLFLPMLISSSKAPNLLMVSSMAGKVGAPTRAFYAGSKHAVHGFFDSLRVEVAPYNVHVGVVCPGTVDTDLRNSAVDNALGAGVAAGSKKNKLSPGVVAKRIIRSSDHQEREVYIPAWFGYIAIWAKILASPVVDWAAARKYKN